MGNDPSITLRQIDGYKFEVDFGALLPPLAVDEAPPVGAGEGPHPEQLLIAGVANCLCASLMFALGKFKQDGQGIVARAGFHLVRNAAGRLRIGGMDVAITLGAPMAAMPRLDRVLAQFEAFCTVSESVQAGIPVSVSVTDGEGTPLRVRCADPAALPLAPIP